jgi:hypothetical protein
MFEVVGKFSRQVFPSVTATIIAAVLISGMNYALSTKVGSVKTNGIESLSHPEAPSRKRALAEFVFNEPERVMEKVALTEAPKAAMTQHAQPVPAAKPAPVARLPEPRPQPARPPEVRQHVNDDALEQARSAIARSPRPASPAVPARAEPAAPAIELPAPPPVLAQPNDGTPRPPARIPQPLAQPMPPQAPVAEAEPSPPQSALGNFFEAMRPSAIFERTRKLNDEINAGLGLPPPIRN